MMFLPLTARCHAVADPIANKFAMGSVGGKVLAAVAFAAGTSGYCPGQWGPCIADAEQRFGLFYFSAVRDQPSSPP
ncbi:hypothetical protein D3C84_267020 [compost metagenome]